jgi:hypothetical protein
VTRAQILRRLAVLALLCSVAGCAQPSAADREAEVVAVMEAFYGAIGAGDAEGAMRLIAPNAMFIETGRIETRDQYEQNHLPRDIDFERQISGER